jgi:cyclic beta-1,2-glucan synthetase
MKIGSSIIHESLNRLKSHIWENDLSQKYAEGEPLLSSELFSAEQMALMGTCDWNDGMNKVGNLGKGESVWLGFFLFEVLNQFTKVAIARGDNEFVDIFGKANKKIQINIEKNAWDGEWYRRAYFDNGQPLESSGNSECQIDSISQSWSVL